MIKIDDLERMLEELFLDDDEDDFEVLRRGGVVILGNCCTYNYASYNG